MQYKFGDKSLEELYTKGRSRKIKVPPHIPDKFVERVNRIEAAVTVLDLREPPSMNFEKMHGYENRFSIRLDQKYRLEFEITFDDAERTTGAVTICKISNHYA